MNCVKCGFQVKPEDKIVVYGAIQHRDCFGAMIDLVEAAEAELKSTRDFYNLAIGVAQAHEARIAALEVDRDNWKARADAAEYEVMTWREIVKQFQELNDELIATRAQLDTLQAAGEWRPVSEAPPTPGPRAARRQNDEHS